MVLPQLTSPLLWLPTIVKPQHVCLAMASIQLWPCKGRQVSKTEVLIFAWMVFYVEHLDAGRTFLPSESMLCSGVYNEPVFRALDYIVYRAGVYGIKLILTFGDNWNRADSKRNYLEWGNATSNSNLFFTDPTIQGFYKAHISKILNRNVSFGPDNCSARRTSCKHTSMGTLFLACRLAMLADFVT